MSAEFARRAVVLGLLTAVAPSAIDMYLPAFGAIAAHFQTTDAQVQLSLVTFFAALAIGQILYGPISDAVGRKGPILFGLVLFVASSIGCAFAPNIETLIALRFLQGIGGCAGTVVTVAVVRDLYSGGDAARMLSLTLLGLSLSPILAPIAGGALIAVGTWQWIFGALVAIGLLMIGFVTLFLRESLPLARRNPVSIGSSLAAFGKLLTSGWFMTATMTAGFTQAALLSYVGGSSFLFMKLHGASPLLYSGIFASNAVAIIGGAQFNGFLIRRFGSKALIGTALTVFLVSSLVLYAVVGLFGAGLWTTVALVFVTLAGIGLIMPTATMLGLEHFGAMAGTAAALGGALQFTTSAIATFLVSALADGTARPLVGVMAGSAIAAGLTWLAFLKLSTRTAAVNPA